MVAPWVVGSLLVCSLLDRASAICPPRCTCHDEQGACLNASLTVVPIQFNPEVQSIDLRANKISSVHYTLAIYTRLLRIDVSSNKITSLGAKNFEGQAKLVYLNASRNHISSLGKDVFKGLVQVRVIDLSHNRIAEVDGGAFRETGELELLDLSGNKLTSLEEPFTLKAAVKLKTLLLNGNEILSVPSEVMKNMPACRLETLDLSDNYVDTVEEAAFPGPCASSLRSLSLAGNAVKDIDKAAFNPLHNLERLDLSFNNLSSVPTHQMSKLGELLELDLSGNVFPEILPVGFQSLFHLRVLRLSYLQQLRGVHVRAFVDNPALEVLVMDNNPGLKTVPPGLFKGNPKLTHLSLSRNGIVTADASLFPLGNLRTLDLTGNPLYCNCSLLWLWRLARLESRLPGGNETERLVTSVRGLDCGGPAEARGPLAYLPEAVVRCETTWLTVAVVTALVLALFGATCVVLLLFNDRRLCRCRGEKAGPGGAEARRLAPGLAGAPPTPVLMLMPGKHFPQDFDKPFDYDPPYPPDYVKKPPHVVYV